MIPALMAALIAVQAAAGPDPREIDHAIQANRLEQARQMLADSMAAGQSGREIDRLTADLAFAKKDWGNALARYAALLQANPKDEISAERAAIASLMLGDSAKAATFVDTAIALDSGSWRAWNAKGVLSDIGRDWESADEAFAKAEQLKPDNSEILNNHGWSLILRGQWDEALTILEQAAILDPKSERIRNNLELARAALADDLPQRQPGESDMDFAARLNDAGMAAEQSGDRKRAIAAFSRALAVSDTWYARAANNLDRVQQR